MLTDAAVSRARSKPRAYKISDGQGLYLHVAPTRNRSFRMRYLDPITGKEQTLTFGLWPSVSLDDARARRDAARAQLARGEDPRTPVCEIAQTRNFEAAARAWHAHRASDWSPVHAGDVLDSLTLHVFPAVGALGLDAITRPRVLDLLRAVQARGSIETARRLGRRIHAVYQYARAEGWTSADSPADVAEALARAPAGARQPALVDVDELRDLVDAVAALEAAPILRLASRFLGLTTVRLAVVRGMRWSEVEGLDEREPLWRVPAARMKGDVYKKADPAHDHLIPLSTAAAAVLRAACAIAGGGPAADQLVFPGRRSQAAPIGTGAIGALYARTAYAGRHVPHGWRASFATVMAERRPADRAAIDLTLAHKPSDLNKVGRAYIRAVYLDLRRELLEEWGTLIAPATLYDSARS